MNETKKTILIADDDQAVCSSLRFLLSRNHFVVQTANIPGDILQQVRQLPDMVILDMNFSRSTDGKEGIEILQRIKVLSPGSIVILITAWASISLAVEGIKKGAFDFVAKPWDNRNLLNTIHTAFSIHCTQMLENADRNSLDKQYNLKNIIGSHPLMVEALQKSMQIAVTNAPVLLCGESGTGKELFAEAIHYNGRQKHEPFVKVNLGGVSQSLFESEMFGHCKGAFTDAKADRKGRVELAEGGTLFLDEIGELDLTSQVKLLRFLQEKTYERLGESQARKANVRIVCATNRDLSQMVMEGTFREDLLYRINLIEIHIPALRERIADIQLLTSQFLLGVANRYNLAEKTITKNALKWLQKQAFPGNVRELKNLIERTALICQSHAIDVEDVQNNTNYSSRNLSATNGVVPLEVAEKQHINKAMKQYKSNITQVAKALSISRGALYRRLDKYNIPYNE